MTKHFYYNIVGTTIFVN